MRFSLKRTPTGIFLERFTEPAAFATQRYDVKIKEIFLLCPKTVLANQVVRELQQHWSPTNLIYYQFRRFTLDKVNIPAGSNTFTTSTLFGGYDAVKFKNFTKKINLFLFLFLSGNIRLVCFLPLLKQKI